MSFKAHHHISPIVGLTTASRRVDELQVAGDPWLISGVGVRPGGPHDTDSVLPHSDPVHLCDGADSAALAASLSPPDQRQGIDSCLPTQIREEHECSALLIGRTVRFSHSLIRWNRLESFIEQAKRDQQKCC